jgi:hypothetical protein
MHYNAVLNLMLTQAGGGGSDLQHNFISAKRRNFFISAKRRNFSIVASPRHADAIAAVVVR